MTLDELRLKYHEHVERQRKVPQQLSTLDLIAAIIAYLEEQEREPDYEQARIDEGGI